MFLFSIPVGLTWIGIAFFTNMDIILVKHFCSAEETGIYSVASIIGKIALFLPGVLINVLFPQVAQNTKDGQSSISTVMVTMLTTLCFSGLYLLMVSLFPGIFISFFGEKYGSAREMLIIITAAMAMFSGINILFGFLLAKTQYLFLIPTYGGIIFTLAAIYSKYHRSPTEIASAVLFGTIVIMLSSIILISVQLRDELHAIVITSYKRLRNITLLD